MCEHKLLYIIIIFFLYTIITIALLYNSLFICLVKINVLVLVYIRRIAYRSDVVAKLNEVVQLRSTRTTEGGPKLIRVNQ